MSLTEKQLADLRAPLAAALVDYESSIRILRITFPVSAGAGLWCLWTLRPYFARWLANSLDLPIAKTNKMLLELQADPSGSFLAFTAFCVVIAVTALRWHSWVQTSLRDLRRPCTVVRHEDVGGRLQDGGAVSQLPSAPSPAHFPVVKAVYSERLGNNLFQYAISRLRFVHRNILVEPAAFEAPPLGAPFAPVPCWADPLPPLDRTLLKARAVDGTGTSLSNASARFLSAASASSGYVMNTRLFLGSEDLIRSWFCPALVPGQAAEEAVSDPTAARLARTGQLVSACLGDSGSTPASAATGAGAESIRDLHGPYLLAPVVRWPDPIDAPVGAAWRRDVAVHVRLGDILWGHHCAYRPLPMSFYRRALVEVGRRLPPAQGEAPGGGAAEQDDAVYVRRLRCIVLVTEDPTNEIIARMVACLRAFLDSCSATAAAGSPRPAVLVHSRSVQADFLALYSAPNLVLSISTFAWWAAFLALPRREAAQRLGGGGTAVYPRWGLFVTHHWRPVPSQSQALHDLTLYDGSWVRGALSEKTPIARAENGVDPALLQGSVATVATAFPRDSLDKHALTITSLGASRLAVAAIACTDADVAATASPDPLVRSMLRPSRSVVELALPGIGRWTGNYRHTLESLFD